MKQLDKLVANKAGFRRIWSVIGQTYPRKLDADLMCILSSLGSTIHKICTDIRLLSSFKEMDEPFESNQVCHLPTKLLFTSYTKSYREIPRYFYLKYLGSIEKELKKVDLFIDYLDKFCP